MMGVLLCCPFSSDAEDESVYVINVVGESDFCGKNDSLSSSDAIKVVYRLSGDAKYNYSATLLSSEDVSSGSIDYPTGQLYSGNPNYREIKVTAPLESGDYRLNVKFYEAADTGRTGSVVAEKTVPLKVVDPIVLTFTLKNTGNSTVSFTAYFVIDGVKAEKTESVSVPANGTTDVTYNYYVKDVKDTKYYLDTDSSNIKSIIGGLGEENTKTFYAHDADYTMITTIIVVVLVILAIILFFVMRKPVVNKGKPKGRR